MGLHENPLLHQSLQMSPNTFGPSSAKRNRLEISGDSRDSPAPSSSSPKSLINDWRANLGAEGDNNNAPGSNGGKAESLLSQALESKPPTAGSIFVRDNLGSNGANESRDLDSGASDTTTSERPESLMDGLIKSSGMGGDHDALRRELSSPGGPGSNPLFPPGLEALYRQAGFPSAFLGLAAGAAASGGSSTPPNGPPHGGLPGLIPSVPQVGLQSHAGNPNRKFASFNHI